MGTAMLRGLALSTMLVCGFGTLAHADGDKKGDRPGSDWISFDQAATKLHDAGYGEILDLGADDGSWKAKAIKDGVEYKVRLDPKSGAIADQHKAGDDDHDDED